MIVLNIFIYDKRNNGTLTKGRTQNIDNVVLYHIHLAAPDICLNMYAQELVTVGYLSLVQHRVYTHV